MCKFVTYPSEPSEQEEMQEILSTLVFTIVESFTKEESSCKPRNNRNI